MISDEANIASAVATPRKRIGGLLLSEVKWNAGIDTGVTFVPPGARWAQ